MQGLESISGFCLKALLGAKAKGIEYDKHVVMRIPGWVTTGKLPAAMIDDTPVLDSTNILKALDSLPSDKPNLYPIDAALNADVILLEDWADESLAWYLLAYRWKNPNNYAAFSEAAFGKAEWFARTFIPRMIRKKTLQKLKAQGLDALSEKELDANFRELCFALNQKLAGRSYFVGSHLTAADIAIYAQLKEIAHTKLAPAYNIMSEFTHLMTFMTRMETE
jgi:glutathione S-transferase